MTDEILELLRRGGAAAYFGEPVTLLEHALQTAVEAERAGAADALVVAALLHDIGHLLHGLPENVAGLGIDARHEDVGGSWLAARFNHAVTEPIRLHVAAKRYLCAVEPGYAKSLSPASIESLTLQGGAMSPDEVRRFEESAWASDAVALRRWDDRAKIPGLGVPGLDHYSSRITSTADMTRHFSVCRLVVFDVAGTTVLDGDAVVDCMHAVVGARADVSAKDVLDVMGLPKPLAIGRLLAARTPLRDDALRLAIEESHRAFREALIARYQEDGAITPAPGVLRVFSALRNAGIRVALDTGFSRDILDTILTQLGWADGTIDCSIASDEVEHGRPHPDMIFRAMRLVGVTDPSRVVKVGDTPSDVMQGLAAGCGLVVGVTCGTHSRHQLEREGVHTIDRLEDLLPLLPLGTA